MPEPNSKQKSELEAFRKAYAQRLPMRITAIEEGWNVVCTSDWSVEALNAVFYKIHNLHGSAASCGFGAVSERAAALEAIVIEVLKEGHPPTTERQFEFALRLDELEQAQKEAAFASAGAASEVIP